MATDAASFYEIIEPEQIPESELADALGKIIDGLFDSRPCSETPEVLQKRLESAFRSFCALAWIVRPTAIHPGGVSGRRIAEAIGVTPQGFSKAAIRWTDMLGGMKNRSQKSEGARAAYKLAGGKTFSKGMRRKTPSHIGTAKIDERRSAKDEAAIDDALSALRGGSRLWTLNDRRVLLEAGLIDEQSMLTEEGKQRMSNPWKQ
jgi:hypothetical protein